MVVDQLRQVAELLGQHLGTAPDRLRAFADYLDLDWSWLVSRCSELGDYGVAGLAQVRSRLLSTAGADRACRFVGDLGRDSTGQ